MTRLFKFLLPMIMVLLLAGCNKGVIEGSSNDLKENNGKRIVEITDIDIDNDNLIDDIFLKYKDLNVILVVKDLDEVLLSVDDEEQIFGNNISDHYICNIYTSGNKVLIGFEYSYTNKYGSTSWLYCYEYQYGKLNKIWDSSQISRIFVDSYDDKNNTVTVNVDGVSKKIKIDEKNEEEYLGYISSLTENGQLASGIELGTMPQYIMCDYNNDSVDELVTRRVVRFGACSVTDNYITVYKFGDEGIEEIESYFASIKPNRVEELFKK